MFQPKSKYLFLNNFHILYDFKLDPIKAYLEESKNMIQKLNKDLKVKYDKWDSEKGTNPNLPDAFEIYETDIMNIGEFNSILNNSTFLAIYSLFENEFFNLCLWCQKAEDFKLGPKDIKGKGYIDQYRKFITKLLNVNLDNLNTEWELLLKYRKIRNLIAHKEGEIIEPEKKIITFIADTNGIQYDDKKKLIKINSIDFQKKFINIVYKYLTGVCDEIIKQKN